MVYIIQVHITYSVTVTEGSPLSSQYTTSQRAFLKGFHIWNTEMSVNLYTVLITGMRKRFRKPRLGVPELPGPSFFSHSHPNKRVGGMS